MDRIAESSHKKFIYCITRNIMEFVQFGMNELKVGQYT